MIQTLRVIGIFLWVGSAFADTLAINTPQLSCAVSQTLDNRQQPVYFTQQPFDEGAQELAIVALDTQQSLVVKRITYNQKKAVACHYPALAITRGGDWGWFLVWADANNVYYTRVDSEAMVFVPPKKLAIAQVTKLEFLSDFQLPTIRVHSNNGAPQLLTTDDEGRNWQVLLAQ